MASDTIEQAIMVRLLSTSSSTAVNDALSNRIFFAEADQNVTRPYCTYAVVSDPHTPFSFDKAAAGEPRIQFSVFDTNRYRGLSVAHTIRDNLDQYQGAIDGVTVLQLNCSGILVRPMPEEANSYMATFDAMVRYVDP